MLTTEEALELMTVEQMMMTRKRQVALRLSEGSLSEDKENKLDAEFWALNHLLNKEADLKGHHLQDLKHAIKTGKSPAEAE